MPWGDVAGEIAVDTADFEAAAALLARAGAVAAALPARILAGAHDTHADGLDHALDRFARQTRIAADVLFARIGATGVLMELAAHGFTSLELGLARAMTP